MNDKNNMSREQVLRWMLEFGTDWVKEERLYDTWADNNLTWVECIRNRWLEFGDSGLRLTSKALESLNE